MRRRTSLHPNQARGQGFEELQHPRPAQLLLDGEPTLGVDAVDLEDALGEVETDRGNLDGGRLLLGCFNNDHPMALRRRTQGPAAPSV
jgi:hypothetical protein